MGTIVVGIDFSKGSDRALRLAIDIANKWHSDIRMVWVETKKVGKDIVDLSNKHMAEMAEETQSKLKASKIDFKIRQGKVYTELAKEANELKAIMLIIGTHGASGYEKRFIGSNAVKTIAIAKSPVLCVREEFNFNKPLETILLPIDSTQDTRQKVPFTTEMAKIFKSKIHVLGLYTSKLPEIRNLTNTYVTQVEKYLKQEHVDYTKEFRQAENVTITTLEYAQEVKADLIAIMSEQETSFSNLFLGSYAHQMLHTSPVPILTLHPEDIYAISK